MVHLAQVLFMVFPSVRFFTQLNKFLDTDYSNFFLKNFHTKHLENLKFQHFFSFQIYGNISQHQIKTPPTTPTKTKREMESFFSSFLVVLNKKRFLLFFIYFFKFRSLCWKTLTGFSGNLQI